MGNNDKREQQRLRLRSNRLYQSMTNVTRYMDRYYLDAVIGLIPGWGDALTLLAALPFLYFSTRVIRSLPLTLAILNNALRDVLLGMIPFFVGDVIDIFHRANTQNMRMVEGFVEGDEEIIRTVNRRALQSGLAIVLMVALIGLMFWVLAHLLGTVASHFSS